MGHLVHEFCQTSEAIEKPLGTAQDEQMVAIPVLAHEIRNAMISLRELAAEANKASGPVPRARALAGITRTADFVMTLLDDTLVQARIVQADAASRRDPVILRNLVEDCLSLVSADALARGLSIEVNLDTDLPPAFIGDATRIRQIVSNLLRNAVRHSGSERILLAVRIRNGRLRFLVRDWGKGLGKAELHTMFQPLSQVKSSDFARRSNGLGLFICRRLAGIMGGRVFARSTPGQGAAFALTVPFVPLPLPEHADRPRQSKPRAAHGTVLVVEDDAVLGELIMLSLRRAGCTVHLARNLSAVATVLQTAEVHLVLSDHRIGLTHTLTDVGKLIDALPTALRPVMLAMSGLALSDTRREAAAAGFVTLIDKTVGIRSLTEAVLTHLAQRGEPARAS